MTLFMLDKYRLFITAIVFLNLVPAGYALANAAKTGPTEWRLGGQQLNLASPAGHVWVNKDAKLILKLVPSRYNALVGHFISLHRKPYTKADGLDKGWQARKPYNNYCGLVYLGAPGKVWTQDELAEIKKRLLPNGGTSDQAVISREGEYLRNLMLEAIGYEVSPERGRKYYERLQKAEVLENTANSVVIQLPYRKPKQKDRYVTFSLFLVKGKLLGTVYYQNDPSITELAQVRDLTMEWKGGLMAVNQ